MRHRLLARSLCPLGMALQTSVVVHHSIDANHGNSNYSTVFPIWDMIFGTHTDPMLVEARETGIDQDPIPRRFLSEFLSPLTFRRLVLNRRGFGSKGE